VSLNTIELTHVQLIEESLVAPDVEGFRSMVRTITLDGVFLTGYAVLMVSAKLLNVVFS
jgi:hypothetical protein